MPRLSILALPLAADSILMLAVTLSTRFSRHKTPVRRPSEASGDNEAI